eukprot:gb/GEZN01012562.1/.p1 GENE.gb/GEZN01012562.1/~~gb/GEZN01012562.1/.p1  ORF type:complete len:309 (-),score=7.13 gb/GEZN01012562.1/:61-987(-)
MITVESMAKRLAPSCASDEGPSHKKLHSSDCYGSRASLLTIPAPQWRNICEWADVSATQFIRILGLVCKVLARLQMERLAWPLTLDMGRSNEPPYKLWKRWRNYKLHFHTVVLPVEADDWTFARARLMQFGVHRLNLTRCHRMTNVGMAYIATLQLRHLDLSKCHWITDEWLVHLASLPLHHLNIMGCTQITDAGLAHLVTLPLQHLNLDSCVRITNAGLAHLVSLPLQHLNLASCTRITNAGITHLAALKLQSLNLSKCEITDAGLAHLADAGLPLQELVLSRGRITNTGLAQLDKLALKRLDVQDP